MSILIAVTEKTTRQGTHPTPIPKLYGVPFITQLLDNGTSATVILDGKRDNEERIVSETYATVEALANVGYIDFLLPLTITEDGSSISLRACAIVEVYDNNAGKGVVRYRDAEKIEDKFYTVDEDIAAIVALIPTVSESAGTFQYEKTFTQAEVRAFNTDNGGFGNEILPTPGVGKVYVISNPVIRWDGLNGAVQTAGLLWIYYYNESNATFQLPIGAATFFSDASLIQLPYNNNTKGSMPGADGLYPDDNQPIMLYTDAAQSTWLGTMQLKFDYKIIDFGTPLS
jgi:hypothetical protein